MINSIRYPFCPVCGSAGISKVFSVKDFSVSGEEFEIYQCSSCTLRFTQDVPDEMNIGRYYQSSDYISHSNTSKGMINRVYQVVRTRANRGKRKLIESVTGKTKGNLLDIGSGTGYFAAEMKTGGWQVTGLEPDEGARRHAAEINNINLQPAEQLFNLPADHFDVITLWHVLEHVHKLKDYIRQIKRLLKKDGKLVIAVPNYTCKDAAYYQEYWAAYDVPRHLYHFSPASMQYLVEKEGLKLECMKPMWFDSYYVSLLSSRYKKGNTDWVNAMKSGLLSNREGKRDVKKCSSVIYIISR
jgi:2-polyprenyl-3-methyl-5-hydroxy-6-metoxy-1,4-benzoquinol methylase